MDLEWKENDFYSSRTYNYYEAMCTVIVFVLFWVMKQVYE